MRFNRKFAFMFGSVSALIQDVSEGFEVCRQCDRHTCSDKAQIVDFQPRSDGLATAPQICQCNEQSIVDGCFLIHQSAEFLIRVARAKGWGIGFLSTERTNVVNAIRAWVPLGPGPAFDEVVYHHHRPRHADPHWAHLECASRLKAKGYKTIISIEADLSGAAVARRSGFETWSLAPSPGRLSGVANVSSMRRLHLALKARTAESFETDNFALLKARRVYVNGRTPAITAFDQAEKLGLKHSIANNSQ